LLQGLRRVALAAQPQVAVGRGRDEGRVALLARVGDAERDLARAQGGEDVVVEPGLVAELERRAPAAGQRVEERLEPRQVLLQVGRELEQRGAELRAE